MAKKIKDYYDINCARLLAEKILSAWPEFNKNKFIAFLRTRLSKEEFLGRQDLFVTAFEKHLRSNYEKDISIFNSILGVELQTTTGMFTCGWWLWPISRYIEKHGTKNPTLSIDFIYELTKRFTGEFAIRPIISLEPKKTLRVILKWSKDKNVHVRRLASEGIRTRLPWAKKSIAAISEFELYKKILTNLKNDKEKFVQKSVGNNLNDLMKENPFMAKQIISEWTNDNPSKETLWIIKHGLRSERKNK